MNQMKETRSKLTEFAYKWKDVVVIISVLISCMVIIMQNSKESGEQTANIKYLMDENQSVSQRLYALEKRQMVQDTINMRILNRLEALSDRQDKCEVEVIRLMKQSGMIPYEWKKIQ